MDTSSSLPQPTTGQPRSVQPGMGRGVVDSDDPGWIDRLVELRVLAEHGDAASAAAAQQWIATDPTVRQMQESLQHFHDWLQSNPPTVTELPTHSGHPVAARATTGPAAMDRVRRLREERQDEQQDLVIDIKEIGHQHASILDAITATLAQHGDLLEQQHGLLVDILHRLDSNGSPQNCSADTRLV